jgi:hypothetical protein
MPHLYNNMAVLTLDELVPRFYQNDKSVSNACRRNERRGHGIRRVQLGGNGRQMLIDYDSLPSHIREHFRDPRQVDHILERFYETDNEAVDFYQNYRFDDGGYISDEIQRRYVTNASVLKACQRLRVARETERVKARDTIRDVMHTLCVDAESFNAILQKKWDREHTLPGHPARFRQLYNRFESEGYAVLVSKKHGNQNRRVVDQDTETLLNNIFATQAHKPTFAEVTRQYEAFLAGYIEVINPGTGELYDPKGYSRISASTVYGYLSKWENKAATYTVRSGDRQRLMGQFKPYHSLDRPQYAGSIISVDDRQPPFEYAKGQRAWFYLAIDLASECFTTAVWGKTKEGIILEFYRQMVRNHHEWGLGMPWEIEAESSLNSQFKGTFLEAGQMFQAVRIEANNARGKRVEQYFRPLRYEYEKPAEGWLARPFAQLESNQASALQAKPRYIPYDALIEARLADIDRWNNTPHSIHKEMTRWEYFIHKQHADLKPINWRGILPHLGYKTETSVNLGIIKLQRSEWLLGEGGQVCTGDRLIRLMQQVEGRDVDVYWLSGNDGEVMKALVYTGDQYVCEAVAKPTYNRAVLEQTDADLANREVMSKYVATIEGYRMGRVKEIERVLVVDNTPAPAGGFRMPSPYREAASLPDVRHSSQNQVEVMPAPDDLLENDIETTFKRDIDDRW